MGVVGWKVGPENLLILLAGFGFVAAADYAPTAPTVLARFLLALCAIALASVVGYSRGLGLLSMFAISLLLVVEAGFVANAFRRED